MRNVLTRAGLRYYRDIKSMSVADLLALKNAGVGSVRLLLEALRASELGILLPEEELVRPESSTEHNDERAVPLTAPVAAGALPEWLRSVRSDFETLARWHQLLGSSDAPAMSSGPEGVTEPVSVRQARDRLADLCAADILPDVDHGRVAATVVEGALAGLDDRDIAILRDRVMADEPMTLDDLGTRFEVTRERIRQIETQLIRRLRERMHGSDLGALATIAASAIGNVVSLRALLQRFPTLSERIPSIGQPVWRFLDRLDDAYEIKDGWCARGRVVDAVQDTVAVLRDAASGATFVELGALEDLDIELSEPWLAYCGVTILRGCALLGRGGMLDRAEVILHTQQEPMSPEDLVAEMSLDRSPRSLRNQLAEDDRFTRVDRNRWALSSWGMSGYLGLRKMIGRSLSAAGGAISLDQLIEEITGQFDVSPSSVVAYASSFPYVTSKGIVRHRGRRDMRRLRRKALAQTRGLYRHEDCVKLRIIVSSEHKRGSGTVLPTALGEEIDLSMAEAKSLQRTDSEGSILVSWRGPQITLGSIRADVQRLGLEAGDTAFLLFGQDGTFAVEPCQLGMSAEARVLALTGGTAGGAALDLWQVIAERIDATAEDREGVVSALTARGDFEVVEAAQKL